MERASRILAILIAIAIVVPGVYLAASTLSRLEMERVTIATYRHQGSLPVWVAEEAGFFDAQGLDVTILEFSGAGLSAQVLRTGGADVAGIPPVLGLQLAGEGTPLKLVHTTVDLRPGTYQLVVRADLEVGALEDLNGMRVAFDNLDSTCLPCRAFQEVFDASGIEVTAVAVPSYKIEQAFEASIVDAAVVVQPYNTFAVETGLAYALLDPRLGPEGDAAVRAYGMVPREGGPAIWMGAAAYWTMESFLAAKPDVVRRITLAIANASAWLSQPENDLAARSILIRYVSGIGPPELYRPAVTAVMKFMEWRSYPNGYVDWPALQRQANAYKAAGLLSETVDVRPLVSTPWFDPSAEAI